MGDFIHLFTGLQKAIQVRDEDDDDEESDEGKTCTVGKKGPERTTFFVQKKAMARVMS